MINRSDILALLTEITKQKAGVAGLSSKDFNFLQDMSHQASHYGYTFSDAQLKWLSSIYRQVYANVEG